MKVKAIERNVAFNKDAKEPKWAYVMQPEYYGQLDVDKVMAGMFLLDKAKCP